MIRLPFLDRVKFFIERQFVKGALHQLLFVIALVGVISLVGGLLIALDSSEEAPWRFGEAVWWAFLRLSDPGYLGDDEGTWRRIVSTVLTVSGYVLFLGTLVAILTRWLISRMQELEQGLTPVSVRHHIVVLGWTNRTVPVLRELMLSSRRVRNFLQEHGAPRLQLAVLADEITVERAKELRRAVTSGRRLRRIILRSGSELNPEHLQRVACASAGAIIVPGRSFGNDTEVTSDVETVKVLLSLDGLAAAALPAVSRFPYVVAEIQGAQMLSVARRAYRGPLELIAGDAVISRLMVQTVRHPGLSGVFNELLSQREGNEFFIRSGAYPVGRTLGEVRGHYPDAILCGVVRRTGAAWTAHLNVGDGFALQPQDKLVLLAASHQDALPQRRRAPAGAAPFPPAVARAAAEVPRETATRRRRVLVLGWSRKVPALVHEFSTYRDEQVELTLVSSLDAAERSRQLARVGHTVAADYRLIEADYSDEAELRAIGPGEYDNILLLSSDRLASGEEADARAMVAYLLLEGLIAECDPRPPVVLELSDPHNELLMGRREGEVIISPMLLSHMLAQVALRPELRVVVEELLTAGGPEISFRDRADYHDVAPQATFTELSRRGREMGETVLGVQRHAVAGAARRLELNPPRGTPLALADGDQVVVLTTYD